MIGNSKAITLWMGVLATMTMLPTTATAAFSTNTGGRRVFVSTPVKLPKRVVGDCMSKDDALLYVEASSSVDEAIEFLFQNRLTGAPVLNQQQELVGMISQFDFLSKVCITASYHVAKLRVFVLCVERI